MEKRKSRNNVSQGTLAKLDAMKRKLIAAPKYPLTNPKYNRDFVPWKNGVYVIWDGDKPYYVGETCLLNHRYGDLGYTKSVRHDFRKKVQRLFGCDDSEITMRMGKRFSISFLAIELGRKELEEYLVTQWAGNVVNKPSDRLRLAMGACPPLSPAD